MQPETLMLADDGTIPNNPRLPVLIFRRAVPTDGPEGAEAVFDAHGWPPAWRDSVYPYHHYHPAAHEALAIAAGWVEVQLGGESGPVLTFTAGDVVVLPAGTGHKRISASPDLLVVGAYPPGQEDAEELRGRPGDYAAAIPRIRALTPPQADPPRDPVHGQPWPVAPGT